LNALSDLLARLGLMELGVPSVQDRDGVVRACAPRRFFALCCRSWTPFGATGRPI
jgi:hypothetical protein